MNHETPSSGWRVAVWLLTIGVLTSASSAALAESGPVDGCAKDSENASFWKRLSESYQKHLFQSDQAAPAPAPAPGLNGPFDEQAAGHREDVVPPPVSSPPWPYSAAR